MDLGLPGWIVQLLQIVSPIVLAVLGVLWAAVKKIQEAQDRLGRRFATIDERLTNESERVDECRVRDEKAHDDLFRRVGGLEQNMASMRGPSGRSRE